MNRDMNHPPPPAAADLDAAAPLAGIPLPAANNAPILQPHQHPLHPLPQMPEDKNVLDENELEWAYEIKDAIIAHEQELRMIPDYEIAQLAVVTLGHEDLHSVLERVFHLQCLRDEYRLHDTVEEGVDLLQRLCQDQQPGHILALDLSVDRDEYIGVFDFARIKPSAVDLPNDWRIYLGAYYYILGAACCNLMCTREGFVTIVECDGMGYHNFSHRMQQRWAQELGMHYPVQSKESLWLNTPTVGTYWKDIVDSMFVACVDDVLRIVCYIDLTVSAAISFLLSTPQNAMQCSQRHVLLCQTLDEFPTITVG